MEIVSRRPLPIREITPGVGLLPAGPDQVDESVVQVEHRIIRGGARPHVATHPHMDPVVHRGPVGPSLQLVAETVRTARVPRVGVIHRQIGDAGRHLIRGRKRGHRQAQLAPQPAGALGEPHAPFHQDLPPGERAGVHGGIGAGTIAADVDAATIRISVPQWCGGPGGGISGPVPVGQGHRWILLLQGQFEFPTVITVPWQERRTAVGRVPQQVPA